MLPKKLPMLLLTLDDVVHDQVQVNCHCFNVTIVTQAKWKHTRCDG